MSSKEFSATVGVDLSEWTLDEIVEYLVDEIDEIGISSKEKLMEALDYDEDDIEEQVNEAMILDYTVGDIRDMLEYLPAQSKFELFMENFDKLTEDDLRK